MTAVAKMLRENRPACMHGPGAEEKGTRGKEGSVRKTISGIVVCLLVATAFGDEYRTFTDTEGRSIEAKIVEFDSAQGRVQIERKDGKTVWVPPSAFSEEDQAYIHRWSQIHTMLDETALKVTVEPVEERSRNRQLVYDTRFDSSYEMGRWGKASKAVSCRMVLKNRSGGPIGPLRIEYRYLIGGKLEYRIPGAFGEVTLAPGEERILTGDMHLLAEHYKISTVYTKEYPSGIDKEVKYGEDELEGVWVRISDPELEGESATRDICMPEKAGAQHLWEDWAPTNALQGLLGPATEAEFLERGAPRDLDHYKRWCGQLWLRYGDSHKMYRDPENVRIHQAGLSVFYRPEYDPDGTTARSTAQLCKRHALYAEAARWYETALPLMQASDNPVVGWLTDVYTALIEIYASASDEKVHDGRKAVGYAQQLLEQDKQDDRYLELLARAYARNGQFDLAVKTQTAAIERVEKTRKDEKDLAEYQKRLALYQNKQPYTEEAVKK